MAKYPAKFSGTGPEPDIEAGYPARTGFNRIFGRFLSLMIDATEDPLHSE